MVDIGIRMQRRRGDAQAFGLARHGRVVDRLHIDVVAVEQEIGDPLALGGIANHDRHDMARVRHMRNARLIERRTQFLYPVLMAHALERACLQVLDRGDRTGSQRRRQRGGEDEARSIGADEIAKRRGGRDIAAHHAKSLAERAFDDRHAIHQAFAFGNAAAARAVHADGVHFIEIGHSAELVGEIADLLDRRDIAIHRIDALEGDQLRRIRIGSGELGFEIVEIVMLPDHPLALAVADAFDHRGVVERVGEDDQAGDLLAERAKGRPVRHIAGIEDQAGFLAMQVGKFLLQQDVVMVGTRNIPGASRTRATVIDRLMHGGNHGRVLAHAQIVVGTPDGYVPFSFGCVSGGARKLTAMPLEIGEHSVAAFLMKTVQFALEKCLEIHLTPQNLSR